MTRIDRVHIDPSDAAPGGATAGVAGNTADGDRGDAAGSVATLQAANLRLEAQLDGLHRALRSRAGIEQAKGVLMAFARCSEADAFGTLTKLSQQRNVRIRVLADELLELAANGFAQADPDTLAGWLRGQVLALAQAAQRPGRR